MSSAAVLQQQQQRHQSPFRRAYKPKNSQQDTFYGHEDTAQLCARFVSHIFACPPELLTSSTPSLAHFVAYALHRTRLHPSVTFTALALLQRLKSRFPAARGSSGHRLFLSAFMIASKVVCDDTYSNKSWAVVGQGMFALREINQMEREMCAYLEWHLNVPSDDLRRFEKEVRRIYSAPPPYALNTVPTMLPPTQSTTTHPASSHPTPPGSEQSSPEPTYNLPPPSTVHKQPPPTAVAPPHSMYPSPPTTPPSPAPSSSDSSSSLSSSPASSDASTLPTPPSALVSHPPPKVLMHADSPDSISSIHASLPHTKHHHHVPHAVTIAPHHYVHRTPVSNHVVKTLAVPCAW